MVANHHILVSVFARDTAKLSSSTLVQPHTEFASKFQYGYWLNLEGRFVGPFLTDDLCPSG